MDEEDRTLLRLARERARSFRDKDKFNLDLDGEEEDFGEVRDELLRLCDLHAKALTDKAAVELAVYFHDVVYDARRGSPSNEHESAMVFDTFAARAPRLSAARMRARSCWPTPRASAFTFRRWRSTSTFPAESRRGSCSRSSRRSTDSGHAHLGFPYHNSAAMIRIRNR